jgi:hypothetical protein
VLWAAISVPLARADTESAAQSTAQSAAAHGSPASAAPSTVAPEAPGDAFKLPLFVNDALAYVFGPDYRAPFIASAAQPGGADIARSAVEFGHVDAWKYGHNLIEISLRKSAAVEPAAGGASGATEFYSIFRSGIGINRITGSPIIRLGPLRDIDLQAGADLQTKNTAFAPAERTLYLGPRFLFILGDGFVNVGVHARKEWNHNGILGRSEDYAVGLDVEPAWSFPFHIGHTSFVFDGFADYNSPKGKDATGAATRTEFLLRSQLKIDLGTALGLRPGTLQFGVGFERWHNLFGKDAGVVPGADQTTPVLSLIVHWGGRRAADTDARSQLR